MTSAILQNGSLTIIGNHPYFPKATEVSMTVPVHSEPPGPPLKNFRACSGVEWMPLTDDFVLSGHSEQTERISLLSMLWDLMGEPVHPDHGRRGNREFALVSNKAGRVSIWRPAKDMLNSASARTLESKEDILSLPDAIRREAV
jgi:hypothetical protein